MAPVLVRKSLRWPMNAPVLRPSVREAAASYLAQGLLPVPLYSRSKRPSEGEKWQERKYTADDFNEEGNIGLLLTPERPLRDVDLDWPETRLFARELLPITMICGRPSASPGHYFFECDGLKEGIKFALP